MSELQATLTTDAIQTPKPFAGIFRRAAAFLIDGVTLYMVAYLLDKVARDALLAFNPWLPWLAHIAALAYFTAAQGPIGKGRTIGKSIMSIVVVDAQGQPLDWVAALRRTLPQQVVFLVIANPDLYCLAMPASMRTSAGFMMTLLMIVALMFVITLLFSIGLHPHKQGWHDVFGGSYVVSDPPSQAFFTSLAGPLDPINERKLAHYWKITLGLFILTSLTMLYRPIVSFRSDDAQSARQELTTLQADYPLGPYFLATVRHPDPQTKEYFIEQVRHQRQLAADQGNDVPTTESLRANMIDDGETAIVQCLRVQGAFDEADLADPDLNQSLQVMRAQLWQEWPQWRLERDQRLAATAESTKNAKEGQRLQAASAMAGQTEYRTFVALLFEPLQVLAHNHIEVRGIVRGPADPAEGPLVFENFSQVRQRQLDAIKATTTAGETTQTEATR